MLICAEQIKLSDLNDNKSGNEYKHTHSHIYTHIHSHTSITFTLFKHSIYSLIIDFTSLCCLTNYRNSICLGHEARNIKTAHVFIRRYYHASVYLWLGLRFFGIFQNRRKTIIAPSLPCFVIF